MKFDDVRAMLDGVPYITPEEARILYDTIIDLKPAQCLELGFAHGASSCYIAAALDEVGAGHLTSVDLESGRSWQSPNIEDLLSKTGLSSFVTVEREDLSYTWFLKKLIEENPHSPERFDFCYIDGPKNWTIDGLAFFLVDKLLNQNAWILFDDYSWTYGAADSWARSELQKSGIHVDSMSTDELTTPHVEAIFKLLVMTHPDYSDFKVQDGNWAWARKTKKSQRTLSVVETIGFRGYVMRLIRKLANRMRIK